VAAADADGGGQVGEPHGRLHGSCEPKHEQSHAMLYRQSAIQCKDI